MTVASPLIKFEASPAESFLSLPGENYSPLFGAPTSPSTTTINPMNVMTPQSAHEDVHTPRLSTFSEHNDMATTPPQDESCGKKQAKKRKSWGQVLPEPKTNLPPRKRAKTEDEKEQRRVERVLRNRRAAQSSRERKRLEVEALEVRNKELENMLVNAQKANLILLEELNRVRRDSGVSTSASSPLNSLHDTALALSQELFSSQDGHSTLSTSAAHLVDKLIESTANPTVNPASLSPELTPVPDEPKHEADVKESDPSEQTTHAFSDLTQHPAEMLLDLQCHQSEKAPESSLGSQTAAPPASDWLLHFRWMVLSAWAILSACQRPLAQIAMSSKAGFSLLPSPQLLTIIWLVTLPPASRVSHDSTSSTWTTSSTTRPTTSSPTLWQRATSPLPATASNSWATTLRFKSLKNILACSPNLARPLMDATMEALRLVSEGCDDRVVACETESGAMPKQDGELTQCLKGIVLPPREMLITLLWVLRLENEKAGQFEDLNPPVLESDSTIPTQHLPMPSDPAFALNNAMGEVSPDMN